MLIDCIENEQAQLDLFSRPFVGYTNLDILKQILENWETRNPEEVQAFLRGDLQYQPFLQAAGKGDIEMIQCLLKKGADKNQRE